jgi:hypothetical protein
MHESPHPAKQRRTEQNKTRQKKLNKSQFFVFIQDRYQQQPYLFESQCRLFLLYFHGSYSYHCISSFVCKSKFDVCLHNGTPDAAGIVHKRLSAILPWWHRSTNRKLQWFNNGCFTCEERFVVSKVIRNNRGANGFRWKRSTYHTHSDRRSL